MTLEELKQELQDCIMSNELLDKENDRLRRQNKEMFKIQQDFFIENARLKQSEEEAVEIIAELKSMLEDYKLENKVLDNMLYEYKKFGFDKELERLKNTEGFGKEIK